MTGKEISKQILSTGLFYRAISHSRETVYEFTLTNGGNDYILKIICYNEDGTYQKIWSHYKRIISFEEVLRTVGSEFGLQLLFHLDLFI